MNWYKKALEQPLLFDEKEWDKTESYKNSGDPIEDLQFLSSSIEMLKVLSDYQIEFDTINFHDTEMKPIYTFSYSNDLYVIDDGSVSKAKSWIDDLSDYRLEEYFPQMDKNEEFWSSIGNNFVVYHGTTEDRIQSIRKNGLLPKNETRGLTNKSTGAAIFTSQEFDTANEYYEVVVEINVSAMKRDGYMPEVSCEEPIQEKELREALARKIGLEDYYYNDGSSDGISEDTIIFYGSIPPKYLKIHENI